MAYNYEYPHFEAPQYNMDWILETIKRIEEEVLGVDNYNYEGENKILDLNDLKANSMASFTENFNVLNAPISGVRRFVFTNGSDTGGFQRCYDLKTMETYERTFSITNGVTVYTSWQKIQHRPGTVLHSLLGMNSGDLNELESNSATLVNGSNTENCATNNLGFVLTWKSIDSSSTIQLWFDINNKFIYIRTFTGSWSAWVEANHIDLTPYIKARGTYRQGSDIISLPRNSSTLALNGVKNLPPASTDFNVLSIGASDNSDQMLLAFQRNNSEIWLRAYTENEWINLTRNTKVFHRKEPYSTVNLITGASYSTGRFTGDLSGYFYVQGVGFDGDATDQYQIIMTAENRLYTHFRNNASWLAPVEFQPKSSMRSLTITSTAEDYSTDDEGRDRYIMGDNLYYEAAKTMDNTYISLPGQSFIHSDEGKQSFKDAILSADLSDIDVVMTNLEQWDMDIPLEELVTKVRDFAQELKAVNPLVSVVLLSVPPIDVPYLGSKLYSYVWPSGNTLAEVDASLSTLSEELGFSYITWHDFKHIDNVKLRSFYDNLDEQPVYKRSLESFVKRQVKNCIE